MKKLGIDRLAVEERLDLLEEIWESLDSESLPIPNEHRVELEARLAEHEADPDDVIEWDEVKRAVLTPRDKE